MCSAENLRVWLVVLILGLAGCGSGDAEPGDRQRAVADAGALVMPFDLDATTHIFTETTDGGVQDVVADDPSDDVTIALIRGHLEEEARLFRVGDFSDPEAIHGPDMPGLGVLKDRFSQIEVGLTQTDLGATITYVSVDPVLVGAIHDWFRAQAADHGGHAEHGVS